MVNVTESVTDISERRSATMTPKEKKKEGEEGKEKEGEGKEGEEEKDKDCLDSLYHFADCLVVRHKTAYSFMPHSESSLIFFLTFTYYLFSVLSIHIFSRKII